MKSLRITLFGLLSSALLSVGLVRAAEHLDPTASYNSVTKSMRTAPDCTLPSSFAKPAPDCTLPSSYVKPAPDCTLPSSFIQSDSANLN